MFSNLYLQYYIYYSKETILYSIPHKKNKMLNHKFVENWLESRPRPLEPYECKGSFLLSLFEPYSNPL